MTIIPEVSENLCSIMTTFTMRTQIDKKKAQQEYIILKKDNPLAYCPSLNHFSPLFVDIPTGLGKSHSVKLTIPKKKKKKIVDKIFFITPNISNFVSFEESSPYLNKTLVLKSVDEQFFDSLYISFNKAKAENYKFDDFKSNFNSLSSDQEFNQYIKSQLSIIYDTCLALDSSNSKNKIILKEKFIENFCIALKEYFLYKYLLDKVDKKNSDRQYASFNKAFKVITNNFVKIFKNLKNSNLKFDKRFDFVADFYPLFRVENYSIFILTSKKLCLGTANFIVKPDNYPTQLVTNVEFIKLENCAVFIDEADSVAEDILHTLIENKSVHLKNYIGDFRCLVACIKEFAPSEEFEISIDFDGKSNYTIKDYFNKIVSISDKYQLFKYSNIDSNSNLISFDDKSRNISFLDIKTTFVSDDGSGKFLCIPYQILKELNLLTKELQHFSKNTLLVVNNEKIKFVLNENKQEEKYLLIQNLLKENKIFWFENLTKEILDLFAYTGKYFSKIKDPFLKKYSEKREVDPDSLEPEELLSSMLNNLLPNFNKSTNKQLFNYILDFFIQSSSQYSHLHLDYLPRPNFYNSGVHTSTISFSLENSNTLNCEFTKLSCTAERLLYNLCQKPVICISATMRINSVFSNFNFYDTGLGRDDIFYNNRPRYLIDGIDKNKAEEIDLKIYEQLYKPYEDKISIDLFNNTVEGDFSVLKDEAKKEASENSKSNKILLLQNKFESYCIKKVIILIKSFNEDLFFKNPLLEVAVSLCFKRHALFQITDDPNKEHQDLIVFKTFFSLLAFTLNPNCHNGLFFTSANLKNYDSDKKYENIFNYLIKLKVVSFMPSLYFICAEDLKNGNFESIKKKIFKENLKSNKNAVFSTYATCSSGANLQIPLDNFERFFLNLIKVDTNLSESNDKNLFFDFDSIYVSSISFLSPIPTNKNREEMDEHEFDNNFTLLDYINNCFCNNKELKPSLSNLILSNFLQDPSYTKKNFDRVYTGKRKGTICSDYCLSVLLKEFKIICQTFGRLFRSNNRFPKLNIFIDEFLRNDLAVCLSEQEDLQKHFGKNPIFAKILASYSKQQGKLSCLPNIDPSKQIPVENHFKNGTATMEYYEQNILSEEPELKNQIIEFSKYLKNFIIHFPTVSKSQYKKMVKNLYYLSDGIFDPKWFYFTIDNKSKFSSYYFDIDTLSINPYRATSNVSESNTYLKIYKNIECISSYFVSNKIPLIWKAQPYVLAKPFFDMYKGELSEQAFLATLLSEDPTLQKLILPLPGNLYEWMDFYNGTDTFIDVKGWSSLSPSTSQSNLDDFLRKLDKKADYICNSLSNLDDSLKMVIVQLVYPEKERLKGVDYSKISIKKRITQNNHKYTYYFIRQLFTFDINGKYIKDNKNINLLINLIKGNNYE